MVADDEGVDNADDVLGFGNLGLREGFRDGVRVGLFLADTLTFLVPQTLITFRARLDAVEPVLEGTMVLLPHAAMPTSQQLRVLEGGLVPVRLEAQYALLQVE
eukprot:10863-Eustigmatos_ZCMA.PRE.1